MRIKKTLTVQVVPKCGGGGEGRSWGAYHDLYRNKFWCLPQPDFVMVMALLKKYLNKILSIFNNNMPKCLNNEFLCYRSSPKPKKPLLPRIWCWPKSWMLWKSSGSRGNSWWQSLRNRWLETSLDWVVTRPLCLVESHTLDVATRQERSLFTSHTFCPNNSSCIFRLNENIHLYPYSCVSLIVELSAKINLR